MKIVTNQTTKLILAMFTHATVLSHQQMQLLVGGTGTGGNKPVDEPDNSGFDESDEPEVIIK